MFYEPNKRPLSIDPFKSLIFPRPIGWISSIDKKGTVNLAPYSYFNAIADDPPQVMFVAAASDKTTQKKDTHTNIIATKEFVVNFATLKTRHQMNLSYREIYNLLYHPNKYRSDQQMILPLYSSAPYMQTRE